MARWALLLPILFAIVAIPFATQRAAKLTPAPFVELRPGDQTMILVLSHRLLCRCRLQCGMSRANPPGSWSTPVLPYPLMLLVSSVLFMKNLPLRKSIWDLYYVSRGRISSSEAHVCMQHAYIHCQLVLKLVFLC